MFNSGGAPRVRAVEEDEAAGAVVEGVSVAVEEDSAMVGVGVAELDPPPPHLLKRPPT
jgi:hypothetical protein